MGAQYNGKNYNSFITYSSVITADAIGNQIHSTEYIQEYLGYEYLKKSNWNIKDGQSQLWIRKSTRDWSGIWETERKRHYKSEALPFTWIK